MSGFSGGAPTLSFGFTALIYLIPLRCETFSARYRQDESNLPNQSVQLIFY